MAWVCRPNQQQTTITDEKTSNWIIMNFGYYRKLALKELHSHSFQNCETSHKRRHTFHDLTYQRLLQRERLEFPLQTCRRNRNELGDVVMCRSTRTASRTFLRRALGNESPTFNKFFELPAEIRLMVYEYALWVPANELQYDDHDFDPKDDDRQMIFSSRGKRPDHSHYKDWVVKFATWYPRRLHRKAWATEPTSRLLALLRVNHQIFDEAVPVFYGVNTFHAETLQDLTHMLLHCGARRRAFFSSISFVYEGHPGPRTVKKAFTLLKEAKCLRKLQILIEDKLHLETSGINIFKPYVSVNQIPGLELLSSIRARQLEFPRVCPRIESFLREKMLTNEDEDEVVGRKVKRARTSRKNEKTA
jgi:hypothetical protein